MFTGIITSVGNITETSRNGDDLRVTVHADYDPAGIAIGASIACSGVCLTVTDRGATGGTAGGGAWFSADISAETLSKTTLGDWRVGSRINLERSLKVGDELGGHIVTGHIDGVGEVLSLLDDGESLRVTIRAPKAIARFIATKGSVTVDGASLTVNTVEGDTFSVNLIPHTRDVTTFGALHEGQPVNLEIDVLARYVARLAEARAD